MRTSKGSLSLMKSRMFTAETDDRGKKVQKKFMKRKDELDKLVKVTDKIKEYIKKNKETLMKKKSEVDRKVFQIRVDHNPILRE